MVDNASYKGAEPKDFLIRNQGCAKLGASFPDLFIDEFAPNKRLGRFASPF